MAGRLLDFASGPGHNPPGRPSASAPSFPSSLEFDVFVNRPGMTPPRVLLVEDDARERVLIRELLEDDGIVVVGEAGDGPAGVALARHLVPDVVVMDLRLPGMGGIEATRLIKEALPTTQVVIMTAYEGPLPERSAEEVGAYAYLVKGSSPKLLRDVIVQARNFKAGLDATA